MSFFSYAGIPLESVRTENFSKRHIHSQDGTTYLYTENDLTVAGWYNPAVTSFTGAGGEEVPVKAAGSFPATTEAAIKHQLSQPRQALIYRDGVPGRTILVSPVPGYPCDCKNGPHVDSVSVREVHGHRSWLVVMRVLTYTNECKRNLTSGDRNPILFHRWTRHQTWDNDFLSTVTTAGEVIFRTDELEKQGKFPDQYRPDLVPVLLNNFKRESVSVVVDMGGTELSYTVTDQERHFNVPGATRIEAFQTSWFAQAGEMQVAVDQVFGFAGNFLGQIINGNAIGAAGAAIGGLPNAAIQLARATMPKFYNSVICRVWGDRGMSRNQLRVIAVGTIINRIGLPTAWVAQDWLMTDDLTGKYVECTATFRSGPEQMLFGPGGAAAQQIIGNIPVALQLWAANGPGGGVAQLVSKFGSETISIQPNEHLPVAVNPGGVQTVLSQAAGVKNKTLDAKGARGSWLGTLIAQEMALPCEVPQAPPDGNKPVIDVRVY